MGIFNWHNIGVNVNPPLPDGTSISLNTSPMILGYFGLNIPVEISTASAYRNPPASIPLSSIISMAHFDTGTNITSIDILLAKHLNLLSLGETPCNTAAGVQMMPNFAIDISFPNTTLSPFRNIPIGSCKLNFDLNECLSNPNNPRNFGILLGRDVMSRWSIVWNGPTSTVIISD